MSKAVSHAQWSLEPYCIGLKLRSLRTSKRLTLARLAAETGLSTALLSKLETDRMIPTLPTLATIAASTAWAWITFSPSPRATRSPSRARPICRATGAARNPVKVTPLNADEEGFRLVAQVVEFPPGGSTVAINAFEETGAVIYVLEGRLRLDAGAMHEVLETGDCACMESEMPLAWSAADKHRCRVLAVRPGVPRARI